MAPPRSRSGVQRGTIFSFEAVLLIAVLVSCWAALNPNYSLLEGGARSPLPCGPSALAGLLLSHYGREGGEMGPAPL
jgi:hypothetical protein